MTPALRGVCRPQLAGERSCGAPTPALAGMVRLLLQRVAWRAEGALYSACVTRLLQLVWSGLFAVPVRRLACVEASSTRLV